MRTDADLFTSLQHVYLGSIGQHDASLVHLSQAYQLSNILGMNDETKCQPGLSIVEREMRRRLFWLLCERHPVHSPRVKQTTDPSTDGSDRTETVIAANPLLIMDDDLNLPLPLAIDDELLTSSGCFPQPPEKTSILAGFHFNSRLFRLLSTILTALRSHTSTSRNPELDPYKILHLPVSHYWIRPASHFYDELDRLLLDLPPHLQLANPQIDPAPAPEEAKPGTIEQLQIGRQAAYDTCRANILITQAMTRFAIRQYAVLLGEEDMQARVGDWAERDVLSLLQQWVFVILGPQRALTCSRMSPESIAANGNAMVRIRACSSAKRTVDRS